MCLHFRRFGARRICSWQGHEGLAMMDFLRGLAPTRGGDTQRAVPLLPSRFSGLRPLTIVTAEAGSDARDDVRDASSMSPSGSTLPVEARSRQSEREVSRGSSPGAAPAADVRHVTDGGAPQPTLMSSSAVVGSAVPRRQRTIARNIGLVPVEQPVVSPIATPQSETRAPEPHVVRESATSRNVTASISYPLSPAAVAERSVAKADARPVIHVTIDRIEVRAPAEPQAPPPRTPGRARSVSLTDYLRRPRNSGGAA